MHNITLEMCWPGMVEYDDFYRVELINRSDEAEFEVVAQEYEKQVRLRANNVEESEQHVQYSELSPGFSYRFKKVHSLKLLYGNPVGSIKISGRLKAVPLPPFADGDTQREQQPLFQPPEIVVVAATTREAENESSAVQLTKTAMKRKARKDSISNGDKDFMLESPSKKLVSELPRTRFHI
ncbi:hypothetical protein GQ600_13557 [Phytophthora cactorum]|nr:hypothetical protein GQ600_13557 [Phytophthora cactorum]